MLELALNFENLLAYLTRGFTQASVWQMVICTLVFTHLTILGVTLYLHRSMAHRSLDLHPAVANFFRFWLWLTTSMLTKAWVAVHRKHHAKCETMEDPHSPVIFGIKTVLLKGAELYKLEAVNKNTLERYGSGTPDDWVERNIYTRFNRFGLFIMLFIDLFLFGALGLTVWAVQMLWIPVFAAGVINGVGHYWGYRTFDIEDNSSNILPWGIIIGGEELHHNHHTYPTSAKFSIRKFEFDLGWLYIKILKTFGLANYKKLPPKLDFYAEKNLIDVETIKGVIKLRYEIMFSFAKGFKKICRELLRELKNDKKVLKFKQLRAVMRWVFIDKSKLNNKQKKHIKLIFKLFPNLKTIAFMYEELKKIWASSNNNVEQLINNLQRWCLDAEKTNIDLLKGMSHKLKLIKA